MGGVVMRDVTFETDVLIASSVLTEKYRVSPRCTRLVVAV
jgi:hypothetical protein